MRFRHIACVLSLALLCTVAACGTDASDAAPEKVDVGKLDVGGYPTRPIDLAQLGDDQAGYRAEAIRIGEATPLITDIDNRYIYTLANSAALGATTPKSPPSVANQDVEAFDTFAPGFIAGWSEQGQRRRDYGIGSAVATHSLRFDDAAHASGAVAAIFDRTVGTPVAIPDQPDARAKYATNPYGLSYLDASIAKGDMVFNIRFEDPVSVPFELGPPTDLTKRAIAKMSERIAEYQPTPLDKIAALPVDVDGMLSRTIPADDQSSSRAGEHRSGMQSGQTFLNFLDEPNPVRTAFEDAGVDHVAVGGDAEVFRTEDTASALRLMQAMAADDGRGDYLPAEHPTNLPQARCMTPSEEKHPSSLTYLPFCYVTFDRYLAHVTSRNLQDLHQKTAAQYALISYDR